MLLKDEAQVFRNWLSNNQKCLFFSFFPSPNMRPNASCSYLKNDVMLLHSEDISPLGL